MAKKRRKAAETAPDKGDSSAALKAEGWMKRDEICAQLDVTSRTLQRKVKKGEVERRQLGREARFRIIPASELEDRADDNKDEVEVAPLMMLPPGPPPSRSQVRARRKRDKTERASRRSQAEAPSPQDVMGVLEKLTDRLVESRTRIALLEEKRDNAVKIGMNLSGKMEALKDGHEEIEAERDKLARQLSTSRAALDEVKDERDELITQLEQAHQALGRLQNQHEAILEQNRLLVSSMVDIQNGLERIATSFLSFPIRKHLALVIMSTSRGLTRGN